MKRNALYRRMLNGDKFPDLDIVDAHGHFNFFNDIPVEEEAADIVEIMNSCGIKQALVFHCGLNDYRVLNDINHRGAMAFPERFIPFAFINMTQGAKTALAELKRCAKLGMKGLKLHASFDIEAFESNKYREIWKFCGDKCWPVIIHGMRSVLAYENPQVNFIGAHFIERINEDKIIQDIVSCENYYLCSSATFCQMGAIAKAVELLGADKIIFGSDYALNSITIRLGEILTADIIITDAKKILGNNIRKLLSQ